MNNQYIKGRRVGKNEKLATYVRRAARYRTGTCIVNKREEGHEDTYLCKEGSAIQN
jgi:hypothetical protein